MNSQALPVTSLAEHGGSLIDAHAPLVSRIAHHLKGRLPEAVEVEDLIQAGMIGLLEAAQKYRSGHGAEFSTFAGIRVRGAMLDEVRRNDWTPRSVYRKSRELSRAIRAVESRTGAEAQPAVIAREMGVGLEEYYRLLQDLRGSRMISVEELAFEDESGEQHLAARADAAGDALQRTELRDELGAAIASLPEREALLLSLYYEKELNLREIGEVMSVSESRVCQLHAQALGRLRARMAD